MDKNFAVGIDIGGTNTKFGVVNRNGEIIEQDRLLTNAYEQVEDFIDALHQLLMPMINRAGGVDAFLGIGMGAPNGNIYTGTIEYAPNLKWKGIIHIARLMQEKISLPTKLTNDANAAAMGEMLFGCAKDCQHFITITLGTGVGSGIVIDGKIVVGHDGFAGELGHTIIRPGGRLHKSTGMRGSLETYASATGVRDTALEMLQKYPEEGSLLRDFSINDLTSKTVYECAIRGDNIANEIFEFTGEILGESLANFVMFSSPEKIVLFGGLTKAGDLLMKPTRKAMEANLLPIFQNKVKLIFSELREADAAILGASALVW
ncbi:MAG: ROK family protein [Chitinophagaceae bacterium]|nr:ROK family protein [Chitinophagaceae bacterium]MBP6046984.1 ROK family protein [Ferruginibacter sp.]NMD29264.1 ROK family protein [Bacteroidota bacterium]MBK7087952.1 ROK family protein [Chitinophagaceae bacterium]MBK7346705.1 ROK family protein [Chitinophagaceae bacterium]